MENALLIGLSRQVALARELDVVANNVANVNTNGFKARSSQFAEYLGTGARADSFPMPDRRLSYVIDTGTPLDMRGGAIERTGNPLDAAIDGDAFFVVQTPAGERYTRNGAFQLDATGRLVTSDGFPVLGDGGPIAYDPQEQGATIAPDGTLATDQGQRGRLRLVRFADAQALRNEGANLFSSPTPAQPAGETSRVHGGALERSNVNSVLEMTRLIEVNRAYANVASTITRMDELRRTAIQRLAEVA